MADSKKKQDQEKQHQNSQTKGEQCLLVIILTTLAVLLIFLIVFAVHLCLVKHTVSDIFRAWVSEDDADKSSEDNALDKGSPSDLSNIPNKENIDQSASGWDNQITPSSESETNEPLFGIKNAMIGVVYLNGSSPRVLCNALKIKDQWSLVPGYCSALWSDRYMTDYISAWSTRYYIDTDFVDLPVLRNVPHPHFNRNDFRNNLGLLQHHKPDKPIGVGSSLPNQRNDKTEILYMNTIDDGKSPLAKAVKRMTQNDCLSAIFAVASPRHYELCYEFNVKSGGCVENGGILQEDSQAIGLFSWMNRCPDMDLPFVVIIFQPFKKWIEDTTATSSTDLETSSA